MAHGFSFPCWHHTRAECTEQEVTRPAAACQCCLWQCEGILLKTCVMESPALSDKPLPFSSMQGTCGCGHTIQWWEVCWCHYEATGGIWSRFADFKTHRVTFQIFADPFSVDVQDSPPVLQMELIDLQCNSELKAKFREVSGNAEKLGHFFRELPPTFPELSRMFKRTMCLFGSTYLCEKTFTPPWTSLSQSTGPDLLMSIFKPHWGFQLFPPSSQMCLSCVRGSGARSLAARSRQEKPMFWRIIHVLMNRSSSEELSSSEESFMFWRTVNFQKGMFKFRGTVQNKP